MIGWTWLSRLVAALPATTCLLVVTALAQEPLPLPARPADKGDRKGAPLARVADSPLLATLVDTHSPAGLPLDEEAPSSARFQALLADPVTGATHPIDPAILRLVRSLATRHPLAAIEVVSGFRSPKLNEALRKKGHHVASHSHAMDFRIVPHQTSLDASAPLDPRDVAAEIRSLGWQGGVGIYRGADDRFVHADTGPLRTWYGQ